MPAENIQHFNLQVLRAMAALYKAFPAPITVEYSTLSVVDRGQDGSITVETGPSSELGTIVWLHDNGYVRGNLLKSSPMSGVPTAAITEAQLSPRSLRVLNAVDGNLGGEAGSAIVANANGPRRQVYADRLMHLLLNG